MAKRTATESLQAIAAFIATSGAIIAALKSLPAIADVKTLLMPQNIAWWGSMLAFAAVSGVLISRLRSSRSRLLQPDSFRIRAESPDHLKGRGDDVENLLASCRTAPLIFLSAESGAGKSTLVRTGLMPRLAGEGIVAVYVNVWGHDWAAGPRKAIQNALRAASLPADVDAAAQSARVLFIFDQFDDYLSAHLERFRSAQDRSFITPDDLAASNDFWREIRDVVVRGDAQCLFVIRDSFAAALDCVRFVTAKSYALHRLPRDAARQLLDAVARSADRANPIISDAENSWPALRDRVADDLSREGSVLPIQMKFVVRGLAELRYLTVREYARRGGLEGIEAGVIAGHVTNAAKGTSVPAAQALAILMAMVDREARKTIARSLADRARRRAG